MNFFKTPVLLKYCYPQLLWDKHSTPQKSDPCLYLTFDDGPVPEVTPFVLNTLEQYQAQATFFCVGENIDRYPDVYQEVLAHRHRVGNHTYHHCNGWKTPDTQYQEEVARCQTAIQQQRGHHPTTSPNLFRPPYGKISRRQIRQLAPQYTIVMWDILSGDFDARLDAETCLQKCIKHTRPGTIIIFHDSYKAQKNLTYVLPRYLQHFAEAGYRFKTL